MLESYGACWKGMGHAEKEWRMLKRNGEC
jgi:hypothetical protein